MELEKTLKPLEYGSANDFQLIQALNHLKGLPVQLAKVESKTDPKADNKSDSKGHKPATPSAPAPADKAPEIQK